MKKLLTLFIILFFGIAPVNSREMKMELPAKSILSSGDELQIPIDREVKRIAIFIRNLIEDESIFLWSERFEGKERPENEIGPKFVRTVKLDPRLEDDSQPIKRDRKQIVLITEKSDEIYFMVEKGKVEIEIYRNK